MSRMMPAALAAAITAVPVTAMMAAVPVTAEAHVTLQTSQAPAGSYYKAVLQVGHGCEGAPTREIRVRVPDGMVSVKPMPKPGWDVEAVRGRGADGTAEAVTEVRWSGGHLLDEHYDEFVFRGKLPETVGAVLHVPVIQTCEQGEHRWIEIPAEGQDSEALAEPAPTLRLTEPLK